MKDNKKTILNYFSKKTFKGDYRGLAKVLNMPLSVCYNNVKKLIKLDYLEHKNGVFKKVGTLKGYNISVSIMEDYQEIETLTNRQKKVIEYLETQNEYVAKIEILSVLRGFYFSEYISLTNKEFIERYKSSQWLLKEYRALTNDIHNINDNMEFTCKMIISRGGKNGGVKLASYEEAQTQIERDMNEAKRKLIYTYKRKKALAKQGQLSIDGVVDYGN